MLIFLYIKLFYKNLMILSFKCNHENEISLDSIDSEKINEIEILLSRQSKIILYYFLRY